MKRAAVCVRTTGTHRVAFLGVVLAALVLSIAACGETASTRLAALASANPSALAPADRDAYFKAVIAPCPDRSTGGDAYDNL
jgi:hypothetical protein